MRYRIQVVAPVLVLFAHWFHLLCLTPTFEESALAHVFVVELARAFVVRLGHRPNMIEVRRQAASFSGELHVSEPSLVPQRLECLLRRSGHTWDRRHPLPWRFQAIVAAQSSREAYCPAIIATRSSCELRRLL